MSNATAAANKKNAATEAPARMHPCSFGRIHDTQMLVYNEPWAHPGAPNHPTADTPLTSLSDGEGGQEGPWRHKRACFGTWLKQKAAESCIANYKNMKKTGGRLGNTAGTKRGGALDA
ncbi:unnamed protein product [Prorocentrum cordatum]|uniref:Uncharacterized protein n=1 Tax=Prorocentrum cordatum TaxID=2364126 RepID=A0ABN9YFL1_9DINO|nr:unnamed protein product [Polarella glacialis]